MRRSNEELWNTTKKTGSGTYWWGYFNETHQQLNDFAAAVRADEAEHAKAPVSKEERS